MTQPDPLARLRARAAGNADIATRAEAQQQLKAWQSDDGSTVIEGTPEAIRAARRAMAYGIAVEEFEKVIPKGQADG